MERVTVELEPLWTRLIRSPAFFVIAALTGVSITFCPLFLFRFGQDGIAITDWRVLTCFAIGYLVPIVHFRLAGAVMRALRQPQPTMRVVSSAE